MSELHQLTQYGCHSESTLANSMKRKKRTTWLPDSSQRALVQHLYQCSLPHKWKTPVFGVFRDNSSLLQSLNSQTYFQWKTNILIVIITLVSKSMVFNKSSQYTGKDSLTFFVIFLSPQKDLILPVVTFPSVSKEVFTRWSSLAIPAQQTCFILYWRKT